MQSNFRRSSLRYAVALAGVTLFVAAGCGGGSSDDSSGGGSGGSAAGDTSSGGDTTTSGGTAGKSGGTGGKGGTSPSGNGGEAGSEAGAGGEGPTGPVKFPPATVFVTTAYMASSPNFQLIGNAGETLGGTFTSAREKSAKYIYIPGVIAGTTQ